MAASGCDDNAAAWLTEHQAPLVGFVLPMVNGDFQAAYIVAHSTAARAPRLPATLPPAPAAGPTTTSSCPSGTGSTCWT